MVCERLLCVTIRVSSLGVGWIDWWLFCICVVCGGQFVCHVVQVWLFSLGGVCRLVCVCDFICCCVRGVLRLILGGLCCVGVYVQIGYVCLICVGFNVWFGLVV